MASNAGVGGSNPSGRTIYLIYKDIFDDFDRRFLREIARSFSKPTVGGSNPLGHNILGSRPCFGGHETAYFHYGDQSKKGGARSAFGDCRTHSNLSWHQNCPHERQAFRHR